MLELDYREISWRLLREILHSSMLSWAQVVAERVVGHDEVRVHHQGRAGTI